LASHRGGTSTGASATVAASAAASRRLLDRAGCAHTRGSSLPARGRVLRTGARTSRQTARHAETPHEHAGTGLWHRRYEPRAGLCGSRF